MSTSEPAYLESRRAVMHHGFGFIVYFCSEILRNECGLSASIASASTQTAFFSISPSLESKATETEHDSSKEEHALRLMEAESLVAQLRAENLAQRNEVRVFKHAC